MTIQFYCTRSHNTHVCGNGCAKACNEMIQDSHIARQTLTASIKATEISESRAKSQMSSAAWAVPMSGDNRFHPITNSGRSGPSGTVLNSAQPTLRLDICHVIYPEETLYQGRHTDIWRPIYTLVLFFISVRETLSLCGRTDLNTRQSQGHRRQLYLTSHSDLPKDCCLVLSEYRYLPDNAQQTGRQ